jgi:tetratricopeptide (TPR) repeat protein
MFGGKPDEAIAAYQKALALDPLHRRAPWAGPGVLRQGGFRQSIATARRITEFDPDDVLANTSLSRSDQRKGIIPQAEEAANRARTLGGKKQLEGQKATGQRS